MAMNTGMNKYRSMMKRMEQMDPSSVARQSEMMRPDNIEQTTRDVFSSEAIKPYEDDILRPPMPMSKFNEELRKEMMKQKDPQSVVRENEMTQNMMSGLSMSDKEAIEALTSMGISLEDAMKAVLEPQTFAREDEMSQTMGPALGALPMSKPVTREGEMSADRTQDMDMQKFNMGT